MLFNPFFLPYNHHAKRALMKFIFILVLMLLSTAPYASERWYQVELLIFANNGAQGLIDERWRQPNAKDTLPQPQTLEQAIANSGYLFESVTQSDKKLLNSAEKMRNHWQYQPLLYRAWRQGLTLDAKAIPVYLNNKIIVKKADPFAVSVTRFNDRFGGGFSSEDLGSIASQSIFELSGTAAVTLKRYLHLELKLHYNRLLKNKDKDQVRAIYHSLETDYLSFEIDETRRMRSTQAHYFDHPTFGVVALITPIEANDADTSISEQLKIETLPAATADKSVNTAPLQ